MKLPTKETNAQKHTRIANAEKAKLEEKRSKEKLERDSRTQRHTEASNLFSNTSTNTIAEMATQDEYNELKAQFEILKLLEI